MTLREKLKSYAMDNHFKKYGELNAKNLEKIADEYAIGFAEWYKNKGEYYEYEKTIKELLEIYKKEKGL